MKNDKYFNLGKIFKSKKGTLYLKFDEGLNIKVTGKNYKGENINAEFSSEDALFLETPASEVNRLVKVGAITQEEGERRKEQIPNFIKQIVKVSPAKND